MRRPLSLQQVRERNERLQAGASPAQEIADWLASQDHQSLYQLEHTLQRFGYSTAQRRAAFGLYHESQSPRSGMLASLALMEC